MFCSEKNIIEDVIRNLKPSHTKCIHICLRYSTYLNLQNYDFRWTYLSRVLCSDDNRIRFIDLYRLTIDVDYTH